MAEWGAFEFLTPVSSGGGVALTTVSVPGNSADVVAKAEGTLLTVAVKSADSVTLTLPPTLSVADLFQISIDIQNVFSAPMGARDLGWLTVSAAGILGMADSADSGLAPDYIPVVGSIVLSPSASRPIRVMKTGQFLGLASITCTFDSDGELTYDGQKTVRVIAPEWTELSNTTWKWNFEVKPTGGQNWPPFSGSFTGLPGALVNLADYL